MHWKQRRSQKSFPANNRNSRSKEECTKFRVNGLFSISNMICEALEEPPHLQLAQFYAPQPLQLHPSFSPLCICAPLSVFTDPLRAKGHHHTGVQCTPHLYKSFIPQPTVLHQPESMVERYSKCTVQLFSDRRLHLCHDLQTCSGSCGAVLQI